MFYFVRLSVRACACLLEGNASSDLKGGSKKGDQRFMTIILTNLNRLKTFYWKIPDKVAVKWILKTPPHLAYVATLPCETLMSAKQTLNDKLQSNIAAHLRCGRVVNNQIKKGLLLSF